MSNDATWTKAPATGEWLENLLGVCFAWVCFPGMLAAMSVPALVRADRVALLVTWALLAVIGLAAIRVVSSRIVRLRERRLRATVAELVAISASQGEQPAPECDRTTREAR